MKETDTDLDCADFLLEVGCEELPPATLQPLSQALTQAITTELSQLGLTFGAVRSYASPRRLALWIESLSTQQQGKTLVKRGPSEAMALDEAGAFTSVARKFAEICQVPVESLSFQVDEKRERGEKQPKGRHLCFIQETAPRATETLLPLVLTQVFARVPMAKRMRWGAGEETFARPVHWVVCLLGEDIVEATFFNLPASRFTQGHRFLCPSPLEIKEAKNYPALLETQGYVLPDFEQRREKIRQDLLTLAAQQGARIVLNEALLTEVTGLVEWPSVLLAQFDPAFLTLPREVLISSMEVHQRCFPLEDGKGGLLPCFLLVSNMTADSAHQVILGNERVMRARLSDAQFFYQQDCGMRLEERHQALKQVVFQAGLGTLWDKSHRLVRISQTIAHALNLDPMVTARAALLCKADLTTQIVVEFPDLQGVMGKALALRDQEAPTVGQAI